MPRMCNAALMKSAGLRVSRALEHALAVAAVVAERLKRGERGLDDRCASLFDVPYFVLGLIKFGSVHSNLIRFVSVRLDII